MSSANPASPAVPELLCTQRVQLDFRNSSNLTPRRTSPPMANTKCRRPCEHVSTRLSDVPILSATWFMKPSLDHHLCTKDVHEKRTPCVFKGAPELVMGGTPHDTGTQGISNTEK